MATMRRYPDGMGTTEKASVEIQGDLLERARPTVDEDEQPALTCIGAFSSGRGDLSKLASEDVFEPEPYR